METIPQIAQEVQQEHFIRSEEFDPEIQCPTCGEYLEFEWGNPGFRDQMSEEITNAYCPHCQEVL